MSLNVPALDCLVGDILINISNSKKNFKMKTENTLKDYESNNCFQREKTIQLK